MGIAMSFILGLFLRSFQFFSAFTSFFYFFNKKTAVALTSYGFVPYFFTFIFYFFNKKTAVALTGCGFACLFFVCPRSITSGLLGNGCLNSIKNYPQFSVFGGNHD